MESQLHQGIHECEQHKDIIDSLSVEKLQLDSKLHAIQADMDEQDRQMHTAQDYCSKLKEALEQTQALLEPPCTEKKALQDSLQQIINERDSLVHSHIDTIERMKQTHDDLVSSVTTELTSLKQSADQQKSDQAPEISHLRDSLRELDEKLILLIEQNGGELQNLCQELENSQLQAK